VDQFRRTWHFEPLRSIRALSDILLFARWCNYTNGELAETSFSTSGGYMLAGAMESLDGTEPSSRSGSSGLVP
jgi:hypothetical protein